MLREGAATSFLMPPDHFYLIALVDFSAFVEASPKRLQVQVKVK